MSQAPLQHALSEALDARGVTPAQFSELMIRLLDHGVLCRSESKKEAELYDRYLQIPELLEDYLSVLHIRLHHERRFTSLRLFPPGAEIPGEADSEDGFNSGLRNRLSQQEVALILVLSAEYDKSLRDGQIDEHGQATLPLEDIALDSKSLLGRPLPEGRPDLGEGDTARRAVQEASPPALFEGAHLLAHPRRRAPEDAGGGREASRLRHGGEGLQLG